MNCLGCGAFAEDRVVKTADQGRITRRRLECASCGGRWTTTERPDKGSFLPPTDRPQNTEETSTGNGQIQDLTSTSYNLTHVLANSLISSESGSSLSLDPRSRSGSGARAIPLPRGPALDYPADFEAIWSACSSGNKFPAWRAWEVFKRPAATVIIPAWAVYLKTRGPLSGFTKHLSTWIRARGWEGTVDANGAHSANGAARNSSHAPFPTAFERAKQSHAQMFAEGEEWERKKRLELKEKV